MFTRANVHIIILKKSEVEVYYDIKKINVTLT